MKHTCFPLLFGFLSKCLLGFMRHDCGSIIVSGKSAPDSGPAVSQRFPTHVLNPLVKVALMPFLSIPTLPVLLGPNARLLLLHSFHLPIHDVLCCPALLVLQSGLTASNSHVFFITTHRSHDLSCIIWTPAWMCGCGN